MPADLYAAARRIAERRDLSYAQLVRAALRREAEAEGIEVEPTESREAVSA